MVRKFLFLLTFITFSANAQLSEPISVPSPTPAGLGSYGMSPISYYSGGVDINIPLYTINTNEKSFPISLNYFGNGVKPDQHPGWVGSNWTLDVGGVIIRTVRDLPDEDYYLYYYDGGTPSTKSLENAGYYYNYEVANVDNWETDDYIRGLAKDRYKYQRDTEPDIFSFHFGEFSGSFYLSEKGKWVIQSNKNIKVVSDDGFIDIPKEDYFIIEAGHDNKNTNTFKGFTILDESGIKYVFGGSLTNIDLTIPYIGGSHYSTYLGNTWHLSKIIFPNGDQIDYEYEKESPILSIMRSMGFSHKIESRNSPLLHCEPAKADYPRNICHISSVISKPAYLKKIETPKEIIEFEISNTTELRYPDDYFGVPVDEYLDPNDDADFIKFLVRSVDSSIEDPILGKDLIEKYQWKKLDKIVVKDKTTQNNEVVSYHFNYSESPNIRLMLNSLNKGLSNSLEWNYTFEYYDDPDIELPNYASPQLDHWGYYNAKKDNTDLLTWDINERVPVSFFENYINERIPSASINVLQEGFLKKIYYPTGGYSSYIYEPHDYSKKLSENRKDVLEIGQNEYAGGIRVRKITDVATEASQVEREFFYTSNFKSGNDISSGILTGDSKYYFHYVGLITDINVDLTQFSSQSLLPFDGNHSLNHVLYSNIIEKNSGDGYTIYTFSNYDNGYPNELAVSHSDIPNRPYEIYDPINDKSLERGHLLQKEYYEGNDRLVKKDVFTYKATDENYIRNLLPGSIGSCSDETVGFATYHAYRTYIYKFLLEQKDEIFYNNTSQGSFVKTTTYKYNSDHLLSHEEILNSDGSENLSTYKYPKDFPDNEVLQEMVKANRLSSVVEKKLYKNNVEVSKTVNDFDKFIVNPSANNKYIIQPAEKKSSYSNGPISTEIKYNQYENNGNILQYTTRSGIINSFQWGYENQFPVLKIEGAKNEKDLYNYVEGVKTSNFGGGGSSGYSYLSTLNFKVDYAGKVKLLFSIQANEEDGTKSSDLISINLNGDLASNFTFSPVAVSDCENSTYIKEFNVTPGDYTVELEMTSQANSWGGCVVLEYPGLIPELVSEGEKEFFYNSFEEYTHAHTATPLVGEKYYNGDYTVPFTIPNNRQYIVDYRYLDGTIWRYIQKTYTNRMVLTEGSAIDEVRVYPADAIISTYTYKPLVGMTSKSDANGIVYFYEYDDFGRLKYIKDQDQNILENHEYQYQAQVE